MDVLPDRAAAWRFISYFAADWTTPLTSEDGCDEAELDVAETRLGLRLPLAVREAYRLIGRREDLTCFQDRLLPPSELFVREGALVFREENQGVAHWGVPLEALDQDDPPVVMWVSLADPAAQATGPWFDRFSLACVEMVLSESVYQPEELSACHDLTAEESADLERRCTRLPLPNYPDGESDTRWYTTPDLLLRENSRQWLWVRARTEEALDDFLAG